MASERSFHEKPRLILQSKRANLYYLEKCREWELTKEVVEHFIRN